MFLLLVTNDIFENNKINYYCHLIESFCLIEHLRILLIYILSIIQKIIKCT